MNTTPNTLPPRAGEKHRSNPERYFHVMTEGWFVFTREGVRGPFIDRSRAQYFLNTHVSDLNADVDPSDSWRL